MLGIARPAFKDAEILPCAQLAQVVGRLNVQLCVASPLQSLCPQRHNTSTRSPLPSQWALQYFEPSEGTQLHAGFAHFFGLAMVHLPRSARRSLARNGPARLYAGFRCAGEGNCRLLGRPNCGFEGLRQCERSLSLSRRTRRRGTGHRMNRSAFPSDPA
jgi:hypothetical protein